MTGNKIITVHSIRRGRRTHRAKRKAPKQSDDYHDGHIKHADRTAKFTRVFQTGKFDCFYFLCLVNIAELCHALLCNFNEIYTKGRFYENIF